MKKKSYKKNLHQEDLLLVIVIGFMALMVIWGASSIPIFKESLPERVKEQQKDQKATTTPEEKKNRTEANFEPEHVVLREAIREVSAYNAGDPYQTNNQPCISANGENICEALALGYGRCAANFVPFGAKLLIETPDKKWEHFCTVTDRMNSRYPNTVDIAMQAHEKERAVNFGRQKLIVKILK